jgi:DNA mismatch repair protein MutS
VFVAGGVGLRGVKNMAKGPGMMDQFDAIKKEHPDTILFFRMGDFYEMFHDDAVVASEVLGITLTSRDKKSDNPVKMAGIPWHSVEEYLRKMLASGHKVTLCEQAPEMQPGEKILRRVVTRVYTPGSLYEESLIGEDATAILAAVIVRGDGIGLAMLDSSTGRARLYQFEGAGRSEALRDEILRTGPAELVASGRDAASEMISGVVKELDRLSISTFESSQSNRLEVVKQHLQVADLGSIDLDSNPLGMEACGLAAGYIASLHLIDAVPLREIVINGNQEYMALDRTTLRNLELTHTLAGERAGSLVNAIDRTKTWMGRRLLRDWLLRPLMNRERIASRSGAIASLVKSSRRLRDLRTALQSMRDLERLSTRLAYERANARDLVAISDALSRMGQLQSILSESKDDMLNSLAQGLTDLSEIRDIINSRLVDEPPLTVREGGMIRDGIDADLDDLRACTAEGDAWLKQFEFNERERLDIPSLKVKFNRQFGYFVEITKTYIDKAPEEYRRRQTLTNAERFTTDSLAEWEEKLLTADSRANQLENRIFLTLRAVVESETATLSKIARKIAQVDVLCCLAEHARQRGWVRPEIVDEDKLEIVAGRHPVLESNSEFVPNDCSFSSNRRCLLLTGPNMGGKSTYLRQVALITILAQTGSFVPAQRAKIGVVDRIFTRVGAHDDLLRGRSTFMVEMIEVAHILRRATKQSLVLLDEIGRGTSTFDGLAIAWSVTEDIANRVGARTLFATHYHQLVGLEDEIPGLVNIHVQVAQLKGELRFLHTVAAGPCDDSYGVQVASLAGLPTAVVERARDLLLFLEQQAGGAKAGSSGIPMRRGEGQSSLFGWMLSDSSTDSARVEVSKTGSDSDDDSDSIAGSSSPPVAAFDACQSAALKRLSQIDPDTLSPRESIDLLYELTGLLRGTHEWLEE